MHPQHMVLHHKMNNPLQAHTALCTVSSLFRTGEGVIYIHYIITVQHASYRPEAILVWYTCKVLQKGHVWTRVHIRSLYSRRSLPTGPLRGDGAAV